MEAGIGDRTRVCEVPLAKEQGLELTQDSLTPEPSVEPRPVPRAGASSQGRTPAAPVPSRLPAAAGGPGEPGFIAVALLSGEPPAPPLQAARPCPHYPSE